MSSSTNNTTQQQTTHTVMPAIIDTEAHSGGMEPRLPFPPVTKSHILHCSYHYWHPRYRTITPKARVVPLTRPFLEYLRADGIILPDDENANEPEWSSDHDSGVYSASDNPDAQGDEDEEEDVAAEWRQVHQTIRRTIDELGGRVVPKLNWSAPKDATWMNANTMECRTANDVYLLLKSSDFVTHDLEHALEDCVDSPDSTLTNDDIPYHLALRKSVPTWNPSVEFRCFVRNRKLLGMCQRDLNHFDFLFKMQDKLRSMINEFFEVRLRDTFPDESFAFDVYIPQPFDRVWLVDFNPWAPRTDPLLFSWMELLDMPEPPDDYADEAGEVEFVRLSIGARPAGQVEEPSVSSSETEDGAETSDDEDDDEADEELWLPELRLVRKTDPEAYNFSTPRYSAHKLPKDVVDASQSGDGLREFARDWQQILEQRQREDAAAESSEDD